MSKSALASITAQYTDSENEEEHVDDDKSSDSQQSQSSQVILPAVSNSSAPRKKKRSKVRRLVSYQDDNVDDAVISESESTESESEEDEEENNASSQENTSSSNAATVTQKESVPQPTEETTNTAEIVEEKTETIKIDKMEKYAHYGFNLPPSPKAKVAPDLAEKIRNLYEKMETKNMDMNRIIQERKEFRNPSIYEKLIHFCDINEFGTNYPPEIYDPLQWGPESYYEELAQVQNTETQKRRRQRKELDKIEQATALARKVEEVAKKRKSKWDQPAPKVVAQALTTTVTGTKGTVISAFGSLPKKPAA